MTLSKLLKLSFLIYNIKYPPCVIEMRSGVWRVELRARFIEGTKATLALLIPLPLFLLLLLSSPLPFKIYSDSYAHSRE